MLFLCPRLRRVDVRPRHVLPELSLFSCISFCQTLCWRCSVKGFEMPKKLVCELMRFSAVKSFTRSTGVVLVSGQ